MSNNACECSQWCINNSVFWLAQMTFDSAVQKLHKWHWSFVKSNIISNALTDQLYINQVYVVCRAAVLEVLKNPGMNNYNLWAQRGKSSAFSNLLAGNQTGFIFSISSMSVCSYYVKDFDPSLTNPYNLWAQRSKWPAFSNLLAGNQPAVAL